MATKEILFYVIFYLSLTMCTTSVWLCNDNENCKEMDENAICARNQCQCPPMKVYSYEKRMCIDAVLYGELCEESSQCNMMFSMAKCTAEGVCKCNEGENYVSGRCRTLNFLDQPCKETLDCYFGYDRQSVECKNNVCRCATGYYQRHSTICRKINYNLNDPCVINGDCIGLSDKAKCLNKKCVISEETTNYSSDTLNENKTLLNRVSFKITNAKKIGEKCNDFGKVCDALSNSICIDYCYCKHGYYPNKDKSICVAEVGETADTEEECGKAKGVKFDKSAKLCICNTNFLIDNDQRSCKKSIVFTASCTFDGQCSPYKAFCDLNAPQKKCKCKETAEYNEELQLCVNKDGLGGACSDSSNCNIQNSICSDSGICICKNGYFEDNNKCLRGIEADCTMDQDCLVDNSVCLGKICKCKNHFVSISANKCLKLANEIGANCTNTEQCNHLKGICQDGQCQCDKGMHSSFGKCYLTKGLGDLCTSIGECFVKSGERTVECRNSKCKCKFGYRTENESCKFNSASTIFKYELIVMILSMWFLNIFFNK